MRKILIVVLISMIQGCVENSTIALYDAADGSPREWLENGFEEKPFSNTLNFYVENNPWSGDFQRAISISKDSVYLVTIEKSKKYDFAYYKIDFENCDGLKSASDSLSKKLKIYENDPALAKKEAVTWLDGPDYTLERFGESRKNVHSYPSPWGYGNIITLAYKVLEVAEHCSNS
ncbi:hypothetical protein PVT68_18130 [Microbulbifer bruguierae]|uniref:Lipoprotein n=1 Tax=Microbulbifer bruguierae TaxID=3029061 RepID=A0ABY8NCK8_9GAMM|nr:hypothetical protein [Microbulbifer bruguierae]WGL16656.1 hypothetical protein PVT68_18130 [Microbulbifer bruguierae]